MSLRQWIVAVCGAWSQLWNTILFGNRDQSFSSRAWEARLLGKWWGRPAVALINRLFWFEPDHCRRAYESDEERTYL